MDQKRSWINSNINSSQRLVIIFTKSIANSFVKLKMINYQTYPAVGKHRLLRYSTPFVTSQYRESRWQWLWWRCISKDDVRWNDHIWRTLHQYNVRQFDKTCHTSSCNINVRWIIPLGIIKHITYNYSRSNHQQICDVHTLILWCITWKPLREKHLVSNLSLKHASIKLKSFMMNHSHEQGVKLIQSIPVISWCISRELAHKIFVNI